MPELPEAETIARALEPFLAGRRIAQAVVLRADLLREPPVSFVQRIRGRLVEKVGRRGKNVVLTLDGHRGIVVNLGMTGRLLLTRAGERAPGALHPGVIFHLDEGPRLIYDDIRRFGSLRAYSADALRSWSRSLGPEPLARSFTVRALASLLNGSRAPIRSWLLDQSRVAGVGNIYANEALFRSGIHPLREAGSLEQEEVRSLHRALRRVLREAVRSRGTTLRDYRDPLGAEGSFGSYLAVYGREGEGCGRCGQPIVRIVLGGRSAFLCPRCQRKP